MTLQTSLAIQAALLAIPTEAAVVDLSPGKDVVVYKPQLRTVVHGECSRSHRECWMFAFTDGSHQTIFDREKAEQMVRDWFPSGPPRNTE